MIGDTLHWIVIFAGAAVALAGAGRLVARGLARWLRANSTTDPDVCRAKSIEFYSSAGGE